MFLVVKNLNKSYGTNENKISVLKDINFSLEKGALCTLLGPSGSGKSTLLNAIGGLEKIDSGSIEINEYEISSLKQNALSNFRRKYLGFIFQFYNLIPDLTVTFPCSSTSKVISVTFRYPLGAASSWNIYVPAFNLIISLCPVCSNHLSLLFLIYSFRFSVLSFLHSHQGYILFCISVSIFPHYPFLLG